MLNKFKNTCLIDNKVIESECGVAISKLSKYVKNHHNITLEEYVLNYYYDNVKPLCHCGCSNEVPFFKGKYNKYLGNHKNTLNCTEEQKLMLSENGKKRYTLDFRLNNLNKTVDEIKLIYDNFINYNINLVDITKKYNIDKRTIKSLWIQIGLITDKKDFENVCKKHQRIWFDKNGKQGGKQYIEDDLLLSIYFFIKENKGKYTINEICNKFSLPISSLVLFKRLCENFGEELIKDNLSYGLSSKTETEFYNVLKYYFNKKIKKGFTLKGKFYDFILNNKILIEYDGDYWHNQLKNHENDKIKDTIAVDNGYIIFRVKESESKNIDILKKIFILYENNI